MSDRPIRFAVVGLGMGVSHCRDLVDARGCELVAICDAAPDRLEKNRQQFNVRATASYAEILSNPDVDVVNICTPSGTHADLAVQALQAGKHVIVEKPPDVTVEAVDRLIQAQRKSGKKVMVIFQARFEPVYREMRKTIQEGRLGDLVGLHGTTNWWRAESYFDSPGKWKGTWKLDGGGSLANQGVHTLDMLQWLGGPVVEVYGKFGCFAHNIETEDKTVATLTFATGALGTLTTTTAAYPGLDRTILVHGSRGSIVVEDDKLVRWRIMADTPEAEREEEQRMLERFGRKGDQDVTTASDPFAFATRGHLLQFEAMAEAIRGDTAPPNSIETGRHTVEVLNAIYHSARSNHPVRIGQS
jgi:UDP-N-acetyl-2-amino-2-deoxyglucuronate dehydrogenase